MHLVHIHQTKSKVNLLVAMAKFLCHEQPKVCYDNFASFQEYVFSLEVSVNNALGMQIAHTLKSYSYNGAWQVVKD